MFDNAILQALHQESYGDVIFIARLAEINGYSSAIINASVRHALTNMPMCGSLPMTTFQGGEHDCFLLYDRFMVNAYRYAQQQNITGWNITQAYTDFVNAYMTPPKGSISGEMLWINPEQNYSGSFSSRYYDEHAETLDMFLEFYLAGIPDAMRYADDQWLSTQAHWVANNSIYEYTANTSAVECEMGAFAQIISEYRNVRGEIPYFDRVMTDLQTKLLADKFDSPGWGVPGVLKHATNNPQLRLQETLGALIALQMLYPNFTEGAKGNFRDMLPVGWQGLASSDLCSDYAFRYFDNNETATDDASLIGAMALFLYGVVPDTGYLAINASEERCQDMRTCFPTSQWRFNYADRTIRIPVIAGNLTFIFGSQPTSQTFDTNGVYDVYFTNDWNNITYTQKVADITTPSLQPVTLQAIPKPYLNETSTNSTTVSSAPPTPTLNGTSLPSPTSTTTNIAKTPLPSEYFVLIVGSIIGAVVTLAVFSYFQLQRNKHTANQKRI
jgi:hypothetical protein